MPVLNIPEDDQIGLAVLRKMPEDAFATAIIELEHSPDSIPSIPGISAEDAAQLKSSIQTMYTIRAYSDVPIEEFVSDVCDALKAEGNLPPTDETSFRDRLSRVLGIDALTVAAKAVLLQNEHEHDFCDARILTDARPVYGDDPSAAPSAVIISHTLKLSYHKGAGGHLNEIYLSLGSRDIGELLQVLERAEKKAQSLRAALEPTRIRFIDPQR